MYSVYLFPGFFCSTHNATHFLYSILRAEICAVVLCYVSIVVCGCVLLCSVKMVAKIQQLVSDYEKRLHEMPYFPRVSYGRRMLLEDGGPNRDFLSFLFCDDGFAMQFLKDVVRRT